MLAPADMLIFGDSSMIAEVMVAICEAARPYGAKTRENLTIAPRHLFRGKGILDCNVTDVGFDGDACREFKDLLRPLLLGMG